MTASQSQKSSAVTPKSPEAQLRGFISKFAPENQKLIRATRRWLRTRMPTATEMVYDNYNFFVIGYSPTQRPSDAVLSIAASAKGVGLCFVYGKTLPDPEKLLRGSGNQTRTVHLDDASMFAHPALDRLIDVAIANSRAAFPRAGRGSLVIRSISAKQRPRRRTT